MSIFGTYTLYLIAEEASDRTWENIRGDLLLVGDNSRITNTAIAIEVMFLYFYTQVPPSSNHREADMHLTVKRPYAYHPRLCLSHPFLALISILPNTH